MFADCRDKDKLVKVVIQEIGSHALTLSHSRHIHIDMLKKLKMKVVELECDQKLQDAVLSVHHSTIISLTQTNCIKIIENQDGKAFIQQAG